MCQHCPDQQRKHCMSCSFVSVTDTVPLAFVSALVKPLKQRPPDRVHAGCNTCLMMTAPKSCTTCVAQDHKQTSDRHDLLSKCAKLEELRCNKCSARLQFSCELQCFASTLIVQDTASGDACEHKQLQNRAGMLALQHKLQPISLAQVWV